jgi:hypothetical protein
MQSFRCPGDGLQNRNGPTEGGAALLSDYREVKRFIADPSEIIGSLKPLTSLVFVTGTH